MEAMVHDPAAGFLGIGAGVDRFAAEIDTALDQPAAAADAAHNVAFRHRRVSTRDEKAFRLMVAQHFHRMLDAAGATRQHDRGIRWRRARRRGLPQREGKKDEPQRVEQDQERTDTSDHRARRNAASTAVRATQVARAVNAKGRRMRTSRSSVDRVAPPVSSPAKVAPAFSSRRTSAAATAPPMLPMKDSMASLRWNSRVTCTSVAPMPCMTSIVKRWVSSAPRAASTT